MKKQKLITAFYKQKTSVAEPNSDPGVAQGESDEIGDEACSSASFPTVSQPAVSSTPILPPPSTLQSSTSSGQTTFDISLDKDSQPIQPRLKDFPKTLIGGQMRSFNSTWYTKYPMLEYSVIKDMAYCFTCRHFTSDTNNSSSFVQGLSDWKNISKRLENHFNSQNSAHHFSLQKQLAYEHSKRTGTVASQISSQHKNEIIRNRTVLAAHVEVVLLCAQQEIGLRGHFEKDPKQNRGNFLVILDLLKKYNPELKKKSLEMPNNAKYTSRPTQNELIAICGSLVQNMIAAEINDFISCYSLIADESRDNAGIEQLCICVRYVYKEEVKERFLGFVDLHKFNAESIYLAITDFQKRLGLDIKKCVAQSYDGASVMSGDINGVRAKIEAEVGGLCPYIHCYAHRLNLVLVHCCTTLPAVNELLGLLQAIYNFQANSSLRSEYFHEAQIALGYTALKLPNSCNTRWASKKKGLHYFRMRFDAVVMALETIIENGKNEEVALCTGFMSQLLSFKKVLMIIMMDEILCSTNALSEYLQCPELVYTRAMSLCQATMKALENLRNDSDFQKIWNEASALSTKVFIDVPDPDEEVKTTQRKRTISKRLAGTIVLETTGARTSEFKTVFQELRATYYEVIDTFLAELKRRLTSNDNISKWLSASDPTQDTFLNTEDVLSFCASFNRFEFDLPSLKCQLAVARKLLKSENIDRPLKCFKYLLTMKDGFKDLILYYNLVLSVPVSSATGERTFSAMNRVKSDLRSTTTEERMSSLTLLSFERDLSDRLKETPYVVVDEFGKAPQRRISFLL